MNFGIPELSMKLIIEAITAFDQIECVLIFGSRAMGNYKNGSDVDLAIMGDHIDYELVNELSVQLNEILPLPYYFDVLGYELLNSDELRKHIDEYGKVLYKKSHV